MRHQFILILLFIAGLLSFSPDMVAQQTSATTAVTDCGCDFVHPSGSWKIDGVDLGVQPGDVICLESGVRGRMWIDNVVGTEAEPVVIQNCGGQVDIQTNPDTYGIAMVNSKHFRLTGSGDPNYKYGIRANEKMSAGGLSTNLEIDHVEVYWAGFAGFMVKTDPNCDPATWRENFTMYDVSLHDNYAHNTDDGEGFYVGFTFYDGYTITCNGAEQTVYGHVIVGLEMYNNITHNTGAEGIQVGSTPVGADIHDNVVTKFGQRPFANYQNNGVQLGSGTGGRFYNNWIEDGPGNGLIVFGIADNVIYNNVIVDAGSSGVFCDERGTPTGDGFKYLNNTIVNPAGNGITIYADLVDLNHIKNNIIVNPGEDFVKKLNNNVNVDMSNNLFADTMAEAGFRDGAGSNFRLLPSSDAVDEGTDLSGFGVVADFVGQERPYGAAYDIGAYEFLPTLKLAGSPADSKIQLSWSVDTNLPGITWNIVYTGTVGSPPSPIVGLPEGTRSYSLTSLTNYEWYTITLEGVDGSGVILSDSVMVMPTDKFVYLPTVIK